MCVISANNCCFSLPAFTFSSSSLLCSAIRAALNFLSALLVALWAADNYNKITSMNFNLILEQPQTCSPLVSLVVEYSPF